MYSWRIANRPRRLVFSQDGNEIRESAVRRKRWPVIIPAEQVAGGRVHDQSHRYRETAQFAVAPGLVCALILRAFWCRFMSSAIAFAAGSVLAFERDEQLRPQFPAARSLAPHCKIRAAEDFSRHADSRGTIKHSRPERCGIRTVPPACEDASLLGAGSPLLICGIHPRPEEQATVSEGS